MLDKRFEFKTIPKGEEFWLREVLSALDNNIKKGTALKKVVLKLFLTGTAAPRMKMRLRLS